MNTLSKAFISLLMMMIGSFDFSLIQFELSGFLFFLVFFLILAFFLTSLLTIVHIDGYRQTVLLYGDAPLV